MADTSTASKAPEVTPDTPSEPAEYTGVIGMDSASRSFGERFGTFSSKYAIIGIWVLLIALYSALVPKIFLTEGTFRTIFGSQQNTALVFLTAALLCTIIIGEFVDMSVASNFGLAATTVSVLTVNHGWNVWLAALTAILFSTLVGLVNAWLVVRLGVNTIVVTLGMSTFILGIALWMTNMATIFGLPQEFAKITLFKVPGIGLPIGFFYGVALMLIFAYVLRFTPLGRNMRFVGENREVSRLAGVRVTRIRMGAFVFAGLIAGLGGVLTAAGTGGFDATVSQMYLLPIFAATFLGSAVLQPGRFNPLGTLIAVFFLSTGVIGLQMLGAAGWVQNVFYGGVLVIAVTISTVLHRRTH